MTAPTDDTCLLPGGALLYADERTFVRAPEALLYRRLTHIAAWPGWWPHLEVAAAPSGAGGERWWLGLRTGRGRQLRLALRPHGYRHDLGFTLGLAGDLVGRCEYWLEPSHGGTVVHHLLVARTPVARPPRVLQGYRRAVRTGLWGLKDAVQIEARTSGGLLP